MKVTETFIPRDNPAKIFSIIEDFLSKEFDTQIYIDDEIYSELHRNSYDYHVYFPKWTREFHYGDDNRVHFVNLHESNWMSKTIALASFVSNCAEYMQLVGFRSSKVEDYTHYLVGFKNLLIIHFETESN